MDGAARHNDIRERLANGPREEILLELYNAYYLGLMNYAVRICGDRVVANDCIIQVILRVWERRMELPGIVNLRAYLMTSLRHELYAVMKGLHGKLLSGDPLPEEAMPAENSHEEYLIQLQSNKQLKDSLLRSMEQLSQRESELLRLRYFEDLDYDEIAERCGIAKRTAYNIIHEALKKMKVSMANRQNLNFLYDVAFWAPMLTWFFHSMSGK